MDRPLDAEPIRATESVDILSLRPGDWRELAAPINLGEGKISKFNPANASMDETNDLVVIEEGRSISVYGENENDTHGKPLHIGWVRIRVTSQEAKPHYSAQVPVGALQGKRIDVFVR